MRLDDVLAELGPTVGLSSLIGAPEARAAALDAAESLGRPTSAEYRPSWAQDRLRGAVGD